MIKISIKEEDVKIVFIILYFTGITSFLSLLVITMLNIPIPTIAVVVLCNIIFSCLFLLYREDMVLEGDKLIEYLLRGDLNESQN
jgi:hypothetical protein